MGVHIGHSLLVSVECGLDLLGFVREAVSGSGEVGQGLCKARHEVAKLCCNRGKQNNLPWKTRGRKKMNTKYM